MIGPAVLSITSCTTPDAPPNTHLLKEVQDLCALRMPGQLGGVKVQVVPLVQCMLRAQADAQPRQTRQRKPMVSPDRHAHMHTTHNAHHLQTLCLLEQQPSQPGLMPQRTCSAGLVASICSTSSTTRAFWAADSEAVPRYTRPLLPSPRPCSHRRGVHEAVSVGVMGWGMRFDHCHHRSWLSAL